VGRFVEGRGKKGGKLRHYLLYGPQRAKGGLRQWIEVQLLNRKGSPHQRRAGHGECKGSKWALLLNPLGLESGLQVGGFA